MMKRWLQMLGSICRNYLALVSSFTRYASSVPSCGTITCLCWKWSSGIDVSRSQSTIVRCSNWSWRICRPVSTLYKIDGAM
jgi:hypothetical protein